jgi:high affinity sulfate transporter 1
VSRPAPVPLQRRSAVSRAAGWQRWFPGLANLCGYQRNWLRSDLIAGLVITTMLVPVGIAYAEASGVPAICGLYATIAPLLAYAIFGPSRILVLSPDSALTAVILAAVVSIAGADPQRAVAVAAGVAIVSGLACIAAGFARLGFITELLSKPIRYGYMNGIALTVLLSQTPKMLGFSTESTGPLRALWRISREVMAGSAHLPTFLIGAGTLAVILLLKRFPRVPGILLAVVAATLAVSWFNLEAHGVTVLGTLPQGVPMPRLPALRLDDILPIASAGLAVALISFADTSILSRTFAARLRTPVDSNQEVIGLGAANLASGFFQGIPISTSASRTLIAEATGAKTQLMAVVAALAVLLLIVFGPELLSNLPNGALAAVVIASVLGLFEFADLKRIYRIHRWEFWLSMACFAGVAVFGAIQGIAIAVGIAILEFLWRAWRPHSAVLGRIEGVTGFQDIARNPEASPVPGLVLLRWDAPLFFANAEQFHDRVLDAVANSPGPVRWVVVAAEPVTSIDVTAADALCELDDALAAAGIELRFAEMKDPARDRLIRFGLTDRFPRGRFFGTLTEAVEVYVSSRERG